MAANPKWRWVRWSYLTAAVFSTASAVLTFARGHGVGFQAALAVAWTVSAVLAFVRPPRWMR